MVKAGVFLAGGVMMLLLVALPRHTPMSEKELARRVAQSDPRWNNYDEDLKAQLGAAAVAEWEGNLIRIQWASGVLQVSFSIRGPWAERDFAIPILLQFPNNQTLRNETAVRDGKRVTYRYSTSFEEPPQWVAVRYPFYGERRIVLSEEGLWEAGEEG
ncbi:MAG: hypothetical protein R6V12_07170 [Candidatus Hydrogenedentota bacterium]